jgi:uncharacterized protein (TIGR03435 family)
MWRALLVERVKLQAHYETRERPGFNLVFAKSDKRLGPDLQPSSLDCTKPPEPLNFAGQPDQKAIEAMAMTRCNPMMIMSASSQSVLSGGISLPILLRTISSAAGRPVADQTGLDGSYSVKLRFAREGPLILPGGASAPPAPTDEVPSLFTAVQEQLGLKLESATIKGQVLVVDHVERPTEN